jgi:predicted ATPase
LIRTLTLAGFKRFTQSTLNMAPLTVLTGLNGSGKTSVIHALLLMREAARVSTKGAVLLNGPFGLQLGTVEDVCNWEASDDIAFQIADEGGEHMWRFAYASHEARYLVAELVPENPPVGFRASNGAFAYLAAERHGPRSALGASSLPFDELEIGTQGENAAQILEVNGLLPVLDERHHPSSTGPILLKYEVERWLSEIARPVVIDAVHHAGAGMYSIKFKAPDGEWVRATNMGFGVSYALPIVLAGLTAMPGGLVIVENPEAHLHPAGQSRIGTFLAWLASKGVQVIVETHSDHVLNGMRRAIGEFEMLAAESAIVHFFEANAALNAQELRFTPMGGISHWPNGFFDQYQIDVAALGRVRRKGGTSVVRH